MKNTTRACLNCFLLSVMLVSTSLADPPVMRDAATHEQLSLALQKANKEDPMKKMPTTKGVDPSVVNRPKDILLDSDAICYGGIAALVPKRAIIQIPKDYQNRIKYQLGSKLVSWTEFFAVNRGWITTVEVSRTQAEGNLPLADETQKQISKSGNLIVATYMAGPISLLPLKVPVVTTSKTAKP